MNSQSHLLPVIFLVGLLAAPIRDGRAETVVLGAAADTAIFSEFPDNNLGGLADIAAGVNAHGNYFRMLIRFEVAAALPPDAVVTSAQLRFSVTRQNSFAARPADFSLHRMLASWGEGNKGGSLLGSAATPGEATWNFRAHPSTPWAEAGGLEGTDFVEGPSASVSVGLDQGQHTVESTPLTVADVQSWITTPADNHGWMMRELFEEIALTARRIGSREHPTGAPALVVEYAAPFRIRSVGVTSDRVCLRFDGRAGKSYVVEHRPQLGAGGWTTLTNLPPVVASGEVAVCDPIAAGGRYYRVGEF